LRLLINNRDTLHFSELLSLINYNNQITPKIVTFSELRHNFYLERQIGKQYSDVLNKVWDILSNDTTSNSFNQVLNCFNEYCEDISNFENEDERFLIYNDYETWVERWKTYCKKTSLENRTISDLMRSIALGITNISDDNGLILSTVHMAKGLEFDIVFIIGLNEGTFPDYRTLNNLLMLKEERHNMFVSITRAKRLCYLTFPLEKMMPWGNIKAQSPSQFISKEWILNDKVNDELKGVINEY
jgi:DNA helicase-2/ATP-dependent DNA helicase PcrA